MEEEKTEKKKKKKKSFFDKMFNKGKLKKPKMVAVVYLRNNGNAEFMEVEPKRGFFNINNRNYHERRDCTYTVTKERLPLCVIEEDGLIPKGTNRWHAKDFEEKCAELQDHVLTGIRHAEQVKTEGREGKPMNMKQVVLWIVIAVIAFAVLRPYI